VKKKGSRIKAILKNYELYLFLLPAVFLIFCFAYIPMYGVQIAFKYYKPAEGIWGSAWVGFDQFIQFFNSYQSKNIIWNTVALSLYSVAAGFPIPILLALMLNQMHALKFKKTLQTVTYMPHFISTVVVVGMLSLFLSPTNGIYGNLSRLMGIEPINLMGTPGLFRHIYVWSDIWQHTGWDSIIYLAALSAVDPTLYEAATVDGASKWHKIIHIDLPSLIPTMMILLLLRVGNIMSVGFEKVYLMQNPQTTPVSEIISTYVYKVGIESTQYSYSAAVGLFQTFVNFFLLVLANTVSRRVSENSLW
jgi:putative aldouronate transport system permease protein